VVQALTFAPTGANVAAPTTSLPETVGGERNWDYRYTWVRDASLTMDALWVAVCPDEASKLFTFLAYAAIVSPAILSRFAKHKSTHRPRALRRFTWEYGPSWACWWALAWVWWWMVAVGRMSPGICPTPLPKASLVNKATGGGSRTW
jgi:GH15 family glucan-1,4-alpha-glucosidase